MMLAAAPAGIAAIGGLQALAGAMAARGFARGVGVCTAARQPPVTVLKPLHGDEPLLEAALATLFTQDYADFQIVFGVQDADDGALQVVDRLRARFPGQDVAVVIDRTQHGRNRKVGNLINMYPAARHDLIVIADSDLHVRPDYLRQLVATLRQPGTGLATTLYAGLPASRGLAAILGAAQISHVFLPGAVLARLLGRRDCLGATMALRRRTLERIGGLAALADHLADDNVLGRLVAAEGLAVRLAGTVPLTTVPETTIGALFEHELRWARTIRRLAPMGFVASALQHPCAWAALALALAPGPEMTLLFMAAWLARASAAWSVDRTLLRLIGHTGLAKPASLVLVPLRDLMSVAVMAASYAGRGVRWRGHSMTADSGILVQGATPPRRIARNEEILSP